MKKQIEQHNKIDIQLNTEVVIHGINVYKLKTKDNKINYKLAGKVEDLNIIGSGDSIDSAIRNFALNYNYGYLKRGDKSNERK